MSLSEPKTHTHHTIDWRGWVALAWVAWFGLLYGKMVVETRGDKLAAFVRRGSGVSHSQQIIR